MGLRNFKDKALRYCAFTKRELKDTLIVILLYTLIVGFDDKRDTFNLALWILNLLQMLVIVAVTVLVHHFAQRLWAAKEGYYVEHKIWWYGMIIALAAAIISRGKVWMLIATGMMLHHHAAHRLGKFKYEMNFWDVAETALAGPLANVLVATFIKQLGIWFAAGSASSGFINTFFIFNLGYAAWNLLPIPPLDGSRIFFGSKLVYMLVLASFWAYFLLALAGIYSYIFAILIGIAAWLFAAIKETK